MKRTMQIGVASTLLMIFPLLGWSDEPSCVREIEREFFNPVFVSQALSLHDVSQSAWSEVNRVLKQKNGDIPGRVRDRAAKMNPNPFDTPFQAKEAKQVLQDVLYEILTETLASFNITDPTEIREMFNYIREQQADKFIRCFGKDDEGKGKTGTKATR
jgi:hypothetical protein